MVSGPILLVIFAASIAVLLGSIIWLRVNPFLALLGTAILTAFLVGMPIAEIGPAITTGFGRTLAGIGIVIALGIILGNILMEARATDQIAHQLLRLSGDRNAPLAVNLTGYLASIPMFVDAAFVIFMPLARRLSVQTGIPLIAFATALGVGLMTTHALVIPTPGPLAVLENLSLDAGIFMLYALVAALPASLLGGWLYGLLLARRARRPVYAAVAAGGGLAAEEDVEPPVQGAGPGGFASLFALLLPVLLILVGSVMALVLPETSPLVGLLRFLGDKNIALLAGVIAAAALLRKYVRKPMQEIVAESAAASGLILLITGAGGAYGYVIAESGIGSYLVETLSAWNVSVLVLGFALAAILRAAQGSATVALVTTSAILSATVVASGASPVLVGLAICAGGTCASLPNDSAFWVVSRFAGLSVPETLRSWTVGGTVAGITAFACVLLLELFSGFLPGL